MEIAHHNFFFIHFIILIIDVDLLNFRIIRMTKTFTPEFECDFDMYWYPFDKQICYIDIVSFGDGSNFIDLNFFELEFTGSRYDFKYQNRNYDFFLVKNILKFYLGTSINTEFQIHLLHLIQGKRISIPL